MSYFDRLIKHIYVEVHSNGNIPLQKKLRFKYTVFYILYKATLEKVMGSKKPILESL